MAARALVALAIVASSVSGAIPATYGRDRAQNQVEGAPLAAVNALLDRREAALAAGDREAWMATVDAGAPAAFKDAQGRQFDGLRRVPIERFALTARTDDTGDLAPEADRFLPETRMTYRLAGFDDRDALDTLWLTFVRRAGEWYVASDTDVADLGLDTSRGMWDTGEVATLTTEHFLVLHHPPQADRARTIAEIAEEAHRTATAAWDKPWSGRIPIVLPSSVDELEILLQSTVDLDKFVAFVSYGTVRDDGWEATAPRMYIQDRNLSANSRTFQVETLVHELIHAAGAPLAGPFVPVWVHEGVADWTARGRPTTERKPDGGDGALPRDHEFTTGDQAGIVRAYREARSAVSYLASRASTGRDAPPALFEAAGRPRIATGNVDYRVDEALRAAAGLGIADLQAGWAAR